MVKSSVNLLNGELVELLPRLFNKIGIVHRIKLTDKTCVRVRTTRTLREIKLLSDSLGLISMLRNNASRWRCFTVFLMRAISSNIKGHENNGRDQCSGFGPVCFLWAHFRLSPVVIDCLCFELNEPPCHPRIGCQVESSIWDMTVLPNIVSDFKISLSIAE